jgi:hypothetical protein
MDPGVEMTASREVLDPGDLHDAVLETLLDRVESGQAQAADLAVAIRFLRDSGITAGRRNVKMTRLKDAVNETQNSIPFPTPSETLTEIHA